jgi:hypothetical protein
VDGCFLPRPEHPDRRRLITNRVAMTLWRDLKVLFAVLPIPHPPSGDSPPMHDLQASSLSVPFSQENAPRDSHCTVLKHSYRPLHELCDSGSCSKCCVSALRTVSPCQRNVWHQYMFACQVSRTAYLVTPRALLSKARGCFGAGGSPCVCLVVVGTIIWHNMAETTHGDIHSIMPNPRK